MTEAVLSPTAAEPRRIGEDRLAVIVGIGMLILALVSLAGPTCSAGW